MNRTYHDLHELFEGYSVTDCDEPDELASVVVRETLDKLFVGEVFHPDGAFDLEVPQSATVEDPLVVPDRFEVASYSITDLEGAYDVELVAEHDTHEYIYEFSGTVRKSESPAVLVQRAEVEERAPAAANGRVR